MNYEQMHATALKHRAQIFVTETSDGHRIQVKATDGTPITDSFPFEHDHVGSILAVSTKVTSSVWELWAEDEHGEGVEFTIAGDTNLYLVEHPSAGPVVVCATCLPRWEEADDPDVGIEATTTTHEIEIDSFGATCESCNADVAANERSKQ